MDQEAHPHRSNGLEEGAAVAKNEAQWMTGKRLVALLSFLTTAMFLVMLDNSIIATTVGFAVFSRSPEPTTHMQ